MDTEEKIKLVTKVITGFNWGNYGLDEVALIRPADADYAVDLAAEIVGQLGDEA